MIDEATYLLAMCVSMIPYYMGLVRRDVINIVSDDLRSRGVMNSIVGLESFLIKQEGGGYIATGSILYKPHGSEADLLDSSMMQTLEMRRLLPKQVFIVEEAEAKTTIDHLLRIHGVGGVKAKDLLKPVVKCRRGNRCLYSTYKQLTETAGFLTLSTECRGRTVVIKSSRFADKLLDTIYNGLVELYNQSMRREGLKPDGEELEKLISGALYRVLKYYVQKYYILLPDSLEVYGFYTLLEQ